MLSGPRKGGPLSCVESLLLEQNPTLIYLRNVKSFVFRAGSTLPKMGLPRATAFRFGQGHFEAVFNSILIAGETKNGRAKSTRWRVWQSCFWGCDMTLGTHPAAPKVRQNHETTKGRKDDTNIHMLN